MAAGKSQTVVGKGVTDFLRHLGERNASPHTIKAYSGDLANFVAYAGSRGWKQIDHIAIRGFLSQLYEKGLSKTSVARSLAALRSLYRWLAREGVVEQNPAKLVATPKRPVKLPRVPTIEEMNSVLEGKMPETASFPERDQKKNATFLSVIRFDLRWLPILPSGKKFSHSFTRIRMRCSSTSAAAG